MRALLSLVAFLALLVATTPASARIAAARLASGPSIACVHDACNGARAKSAQPPAKSYVGERTRVGPWLTGKEEDIEVGLTYFGARYYAPYLGRWASADPLTIHGLGSDLNPYAYVGGRVMRDVDPFGLVTSCGDGCYDFSDEPDRITGRADEIAGRAGPDGRAMGGDRGQRATAALANAVKPGWVTAAQTVVAASNGTSKRRRTGTAGDLASGFAKGTLETHAVIALATGAEAPAGDSALYELGRSVPHLVPVVLGLAEAPATSGAAEGPPGAGSGLEALASRVNPQGFCNNCGSVAIAVDRTLGGAPASATNTGPLLMSEVAGVYGNRGFASYPSLNSISQFMGRAGPGARGIVYGGRAGGEMGHYFNVVNQNGNVVFIDATTGAYANPTGFTFFNMMRTF